MSNVSDILKSNPFGSSPTNNKLMGEYQKAQESALSDDRPKYTTLSELQESGLLRRYHEITRDLIKIESYKIPCSIAKEKLTQEELIIKDVQNTLNECTANIDAQNDVLGTKDERANQALKKIQEILNRKDSAGKYILGGINSNQAPCGDLVANTNILPDGTISTNYTEATPNRQEITISDNDAVRYGLCANELAFAQVIATLNKIKTGTKEEAEAQKQEARKSLEVLELHNGENLKKIKDADNSPMKLHKELEDTFSKSRTEVIQEQNDSMQALLASFAIMTKENRLNDAFNRAFD